MFVFIMCVCVYLCVVVFVPSCDWMRPWRLMSLVLGSPWPWWMELGPGRREAALSVEYGNLMGFIQRLHGFMILAKSSLDTGELIGIPLMDWEYPQYIG